MTALKSFLKPAARFAAAPVSAMRIRDVGVLGERVGCEVGI